jgi:hypothetical protein
MLRAISKEGFLCLCVTRICRTLQPFQPFFLTVVAIDPVVVHKGIHRMNITGFRLGDRRSELRRIQSMAIAWTWGIEIGDSFWHLFAAPRNRT